MVLIPDYENYLKNIYKTFVTSYVTRINLITKFFM